MVTKLLSTWRERMRPPKSRAAVYYESGELLCDQCGLIYAGAQAEPLTCLPCPKCGFQNCVPLELADYLVFEAIGTGGIASVHKSYSREQPDHLLAAKVLKPEHAQTPELAQAFLAECAMHSRVTDHPNVVYYRDGGSVDGMCYCVMDYIHGNKLTDMIEQHGRMLEKSVLSILSHVLAGLRHIHACGFLYRDLNASNVILTPEGRAVLIDFGLVLPIEEARNPPKRAHVWGTGEALPPERILGESEDVVSVVYSIGMFAYYLLTADVLMKATTARGLAMRHISSARLPMTPDRFSGCSDAFMDVIVKMIQPNRAYRHQSFEEVAEDVAALLAAAQAG